MDLQTGLTIKSVVLCKDPPLLCSGDENGQYCRYVSALPMSNLFQAYNIDIWQIAELEVDTDNGTVKEISGPVPVSSTLTKRTSLKVGWKT
jgi:hypothetical protein